MMVAHPTTYKDVQFRSRLEARWAAFFDLAGWRWEYEPTDHNGWTPDFALIGKRDIVKAEVKPIEWCGDDTAIAHEVLERDDLKKVRAYVSSLSGTADDPPLFPDILILGCYPHFADIGMSGVCLGAFLSEKWGASTVDIAFLAGGYEPQQIDFHAFYGSYGYRMGGQQHGDGHIRSLDPDLVHHLWARAGNLTRWKPAK
jgi:hypothetical protein